MGKFWNNFFEGAGGGLGMALSWTLILWLFWPVWERLLLTIINAIKA